MCVSTLHYHTEHELAYFLRGFRKVGHTRWVVVAGLSGARVAPEDLPPNARVIFTTASSSDPQPAIGWFAPDPLQAVVLGMTGLQPGEGLMLLFPADWAGPSPDDLIDAARRWRASPHSPVDDVFFDATHPN
jgi:hypothetical protein